MGLRSLSQLTDSFGNTWRACANALLASSVSPLSPLAAAKFEIRVKGAGTAVDGLAARFNGRVQMPKAEFIVGDPIAPLAQRGITRTKSDSRLNVGLRLLNLAQNT